MRKKVLLSFIAMYGLIFTAFAEDVTATYLQNYAKPFAAGSGFLIQGNERFKEVGTPWIVEGSIGGPMGVADVTGWHLDAKKDNAITLTVGWDKFQENITNAKIYQTVTLPAGSYILRVFSGTDSSGENGTYLVATEGDGLPDIENLNTAIASKVLTGISSTNSIVIKFTLSSSTSLNIGLVASISDRECITAGKFKLETGSVDYEDLDLAIANANEITPDKYPVGTKGGEYSQGKWDAFQAALTDAKAFAAEPRGSHEQSAVDAKKNALKAMMTDFLESMILPFELSDEVTSNWYRIVNKGSRGVDVMYFSMDENRLRYRDSTAVHNEDENFKFVKVAPGIFKMYSYLKPDVALSVKADDAKFIEAAKNPNRDTWKVVKSNVTDHFCILSETINRYMLNAFYNKNEGFVASYWNLSGGGSAWIFLPVTPSGISEETASQFGIKVENRRIVANENVKISVFNIGGQFVDAKSELSPGAYIVKAEGYPKAFKVMVK